MPKVIGALRTGVSMTIGYHNEAEEGVSADTNGHGSEVRPRFGNGPLQRMPLEWAESILSDLAAQQPKLFKEFLHRAAMGDDATVR